MMFADNSNNDSNNKQDSQSIVTRSDQSILQALSSYYNEYRKALFSSSVMSLIPPSMPNFSSSLNVPEAAASRSRFLLTEYMYTYSTEIMISLTV